MSTCYEDYVYPKGMEDYNMVEDSIDEFKEIFLFLLLINFIDKLEVSRLVILFLSSSVIANQLNIIIILKKSNITLMNIIYFILI